VVTYTICRLPSFFEPHWYTDEAGYTVTARALLRGAALYAGAWTNKPPLQIWAVAIPLRLFGPGEPGLHALTFLSGLMALLAVGVLATHLLTARRALVASVLFALAIGLPMFQAQLALPESLLIGPTTWAAVIVFTRLLPDRDPSNPLPRWIFAIGAGALMGLAIGFQQTALADAVVFGVAIALAPGRDRAAIAAYVLALLAVVAAWLVPALVVAGPSVVTFALVGFYSGYVTYSLPTSPLGIALRALGPVLALVALMAIRRTGGRMLALGLWACADLAVSAIANRPYPHFLLPALAPCILLLASVRLPARLPARVRWRMAPLAAALAVSVPFGLVAGVDFNALLAYANWPLAQLRADRIDWDAQLDVRGPADQDVAQWIRDQGLAGTTAVVWSSSAWPYLLADLPVSLPAAPIYNDVVILGSGQAVASAVDSVDPQLIVTSEEALEQWPEIGPLLDGRYQLAHEAYPDKVYIHR
jgi:4-amino-4-deoxy-L-arabinose transferase-like glycosyltransferase